jgi:hypothetical protein
VAVNATPPPRYGDVAVNATPPPRYGDVAVNATPPRHFGERGSLRKHEGVSPDGGTFKSVLAKATATIRRRRTMKMMMRWM